MENLKIDGARLWDSLMEMAQIGATEKGGVNRLALTDAGVYVEDQLFDIVATLKKGTAAKAVLRFGENVVTYDFAAQKLDEMPLKMKDGKATLRVLVDRPMYELIGGGGACYKTSGRCDMGKPIGTISLTAEDGLLTVESLKAYAMTSAWKKE